MGKAESQGHAIPGGWVKLPRAVLQPGHWLHPDATGTPACRLGAFTDLLGLAEWRERNGLAPGQLQESQRELARRWGWSRGRVRRFLEELEEDGLIERDTGEDGEPARITVVNLTS